VRYDLLPIVKVRIDGTDMRFLLDKMGVTIDLKRRVASVGPPPANANVLYDQMEAAMHHCTAAFESGNAAELQECFDLEIVLFAPQGEFRGRKEVMDYLQRRFLQYSPKLSYKMNLQDVKLFGDALWCSYDYEIVSPKEHLIARGMSMCRKDGAYWRILNMHNSLLEAESGASGKP